MFGWIIVLLVGLQQNTVLRAFVPECRSPTLYVLAGTAAKRPHNLPETSSFHNLPVLPKYPTSGSFTFKNSQNNNIPMSTRTGEQRFEGKTNNVSAVQIKTEHFVRQASDSCLSKWKKKSNKSKETFEKFAISPCVRRKSDSLVCDWGVESLLWKAHPGHAWEKARWPLRRGLCNILTEISGILAALHPFKLHCNGACRPPRLRA